MWKEKSLSGIGEDPDKPKIFCKENVKNHLFRQIFPFWWKSGSTESGLTEVYCN